MDVRMSVPFSYLDYTHCDSSRRIELLKSLVRENKAVFPEFDWEEFREVFEEHAPNFHACSHQAAGASMAVRCEDLKEQNKILRQRIEDLCAEMEELKKGEGRVWLLGAGET
jgi:hypothetical protein